MRVHSVNTPSNCSPSATIQNEVGSGERDVNHEYKLTNEGFGSHWISCNTAPSTFSSSPKHHAPSWPIINRNTCIHTISRFFLVKCLVKESSLKCGEARHSCQMTSVDK